MDITPERSSNGNQTHIASFRPELPVEVKGNDGHLTRNTVGNGNGSGPEPEEQVEQDDVQQYEVEPKAVDPHFGGRFGWTRLKGWSCIASCGAAGTGVTAPGGIVAIEFLQTKCQCDGAYGDPDCVPA